MPQYHNLIDPNLAAVDGLWVPTEFDVAEAPHAPTPLVLLVELACLTATGQRLPFGFSHTITQLATGHSVRAECAMRTPIPGYAPHKHVKLHAVAQGLMGAAAPLLAKLRRPALLLPGPVQAVVKAQRIVVDEGDDYAGVWHEDGMEEHVAAVVLYYYRASPTLVGGSLEFCSKQTQAMWSGDAGGDHCSVENAAAFAASLPRCQVPISTGTLVCFSNYAAVHRVLRMEARGGCGSREFMALFIIDQRHPLPTPLRLPPLAERVAACKSLLERQLQPRGTFGLDGSHVYSTGNGSVADVGWMRYGGGGGNTNVEASYPDAASLIGRLNFAPPRLERGVSMMLQGPCPRPEETVVYNPASGWAEAWIGAGEGADCLYVDLTWGNAICEEAPDDGVSEVRCFPRGMPEFAAFVEDQGYWCNDERLRARIAGTAIELIVAGTSTWVLRDQLKPIRRLQGLEEGSRCEVVRFLTERVDAEAQVAGNGGGFTDDTEGAIGGDGVGEPFEVSAWPDCMAFLLHPDAPLRPLEEARGRINYLSQSSRRKLVAELFRIRVNAAWLGSRALEKAANAASDEVGAMLLRS